MNASGKNTVDSRAVHFVHIGDSHVQHDDPSRRHLYRLEATVDRIEQLVRDGVAIDFVVHTGDLVDDADSTGETDAPTRRAMDALVRLSVPWFVLGGNHDRQEFLEIASNASPSLGRVVSAVHPDRTDESAGGSSPGIVDVQLGKLRLVFLNLNPEDGQGDLHGRASPRQVDALERLLLDPGKSGKFAVFSHYPLLAQEAPWTGRPDGAEALVALLERHAVRIAGVFTGHIHRGIHHLSNGVLHVSTPSLSRHFLLWPGQNDHAYVDDNIIGWHYVTIDASGTRVQQHAFNHE